METEVAQRIYDRFFAELPAQGAWGVDVAESLRDLYLEGGLQREKLVLDVYLRLAELAG